MDRRVRLRFIAAGSFAASLSACAIGTEGHQPDNCKGTATDAGARQPVDDLGVPLGPMTGSAVARLPEAHLLLPSSTVVSVTMSDGCSDPAHGRGGQNVPGVAITLVSVPSATAATVLNFYQAQMGSGWHPWEGSTTHPPIGWQRGRELFLVWPSVSDGGSGEHRYEIEVDVYPASVPSPTQVLAVIANLERGDARIARYAAVPPSGEKLAGMSKRSST